MANDDERTVLMAALLGKADAAAVVVVTRKGEVYVGQGDELPRLVLVRALRAVAEQLEQDQVQLVARGFVDTGGE